MRERLKIIGPLATDEAIIEYSHMAQRAEMRLPTVPHHGEPEVREPRRITPRHPQIRDLAVTTAVGMLFSGIGK